MAQQMPSWSPKGRGGDGGVKSFLNSVKKLHNWSFESLLTYIKKQLKELMRNLKILHVVDMRKGEV